MRKKLFDYPKLYSIRYGILTTAVVAVCLFWDLILKFLTDGYNVTIIGDFFKFQSTHNTGAAYGIFAGQTVPLIIVTCVVLALIFAYNWFHKDKSVLYCIGLGMIVGGAIGNLVDRIAFGYVRDFIKFSFFSFTFNIADACLTIGVIIFAIYLIFFDKTFKKKDKNKKQKKQQTVQDKNINDDVEMLSDEKQNSIIYRYNDDE